MGICVAANGLTDGLGYVAGLCTLGSIGAGTGYIGLVDENLNTNFTGSGCADVLCGQEGLGSSCTAVGLVGAAEGAFFDCVGKGLLEAAERVVADLGPVGQFDSA